MEGGGDGWAIGDSDLAIDAEADGEEGFGEEFEVSIEDLTEEKFGTGVDDFDAHEMGEVVVFKGLSAIDLDVLKIAGLAGDGEGDGATADGAIFDTGVVALGGIDRGGKEFTAPRAGDISFD